MPVVSDFTALISDYRWNQLKDPGAPVIVSYRFVETPDLPELDDIAFDPDGVYALGEGQRESVREALDAFEAVAGIRFVETTGPAMLDFHRVTGTGWAGFADYPVAGSELHDGRTAEIYFDRTNPDSFATSFFPVLLHEIGHAMGLEHPFEGDVTLRSDLDTKDNTIMSYTNTGNTYQTLRPLDVDALRYLYGETTALDGWVIDFDAGGLTVIGSADRDVILGVFGPNRIEGGDGDDGLHGESANDTLLGNTGDDHLFGLRGSDSLVGGWGDDVLMGGLGQDTLLGGEGADRLVGDWIQTNGPDNDSDLLKGGNGNDTLFSGADGDTLIGGGGDDSLVGDGAYNGGNDRLEGRAGRDVLYGNTGNDTLFGGDGNDRLVGDGTGNDWGHDVLVGGNGRDTLIGRHGDDLMKGNAGNDRLDGGEGWDTLLGGTGNDTLTAGDELYAGRNSLVGMGGNDSLIGGIGSDTLSGKSGWDALYGHAGNDSLIGGMGQDTLSGGAGWDTLTGGDEGQPDGMRDDFVFSTEDFGQTDQVLAFELGIDRLDISASGFDATDLTSVAVYWTGTLSTLLKFGVLADLQVVLFDRLEADVAALGPDDLFA